MTDEIIYGAEVPETEAILHDEESKTEDPKSGKLLTVKQFKFVEFFMEDYDPNVACLKAGFAATTPAAINQVVDRMFSNPNVVAALKHRFAARHEGGAVTLAKVENRLWEIGTQDKDLRSAAAAAAVLYKGKGGLNQAQGGKTALVINADFKRGETVAVLAKKL